MIMTFAVTDKIGDIVAKFPKAGDILQEQSIDFCCGGDRPLSAAAEEQGLLAQEVLNQLNQAFEQNEAADADTVDWTEAPFHQLVDHVVNTHHAYLHQELPVLSQLTTKILRVHGENHGDTLLQVHRLFHSLKMELEEHLIKEETGVFPLIKKYEANPSAELLDKTIKLNEELNAEHDNAGNLIKEIRKVTEGFTVPADGCRTYERTFRKLEELETDLFKHIHLENNILFVRLEALQASA
ncbi:iron-sulfur cluster repair di-iron protein [Alicyclobacillus sp. SO9]|uniref:iron-sulfur cluster repair di-iron protein n=1 Tax=Alicyclobacillus sp. SO9 TaxID=2665646 RepID=UPI0018E8AAB8|nr:iron-sulfur cluster repair di-iron protein [Alicyclobacillus sp. SO9]QQE78852.1 iron-sulfur cluster repair di-iron protein [Alicyclobacillus sp. SO9]